MIKFPSDFTFGAATSSYQIEGAVQEDGRGPSIWDVFSHTPGAIRNGDTGDIACDHYHRFRDDVQLMKQVGLDSYRFSIAWPRIFPNGTGTVNQKGLDFYKRLVNELLENGIAPMATLYHWDLPQALQDKGGWTNRETADAFGHYADSVYRALGDCIPQFITLNEPWCSAALGHALGQHAPGWTDYSAAVVAGHHLLLAHGTAVQAYRQSGSKGTIGITNILSHVTPASYVVEDVRAAQRYDALSNRWFLDPLFKASYPDELRQLGVDQIVQHGDMALISQPIDFLGVNYYFQQVAKANPGDALIQATLLEPTGKTTAMGWGIAPQGLTEVLTRVHRDYGDIPVYVTESGAAFNDVVTVDANNREVVYDGERIAYIRGHMEAVHNAIQAGADVRGYYVWSLLDNFEWQEGYDRRFGIFYVDYENQRRLWKDSAKWYREVIAERGFMAL